MINNKLKLGTVMFSEDWFNQCMDIHGFDRTNIPKNTIEFVCKLCEGFQAGDSYAPVFVLNTWEEYLFSNK